MKKTIKDYFEELNPKVGEKFRITHIPTEETYGWNNTWMPPMDAAVDKIGIVLFIDTEIYDLYLRIEGMEGYWYPPFVLERVSS